MNDLISRSDVLKLPRYNFGTSVSMLTLEEYIKVSDIKKILTAYSVDKVVEELEERKALHERLAVYETKNGKSTKRYHHIEAIDALNEAIKILNQGGASDVPDDVCKWKFDDDNLITSCGDYFNLYDNCTEKFKYCPRCGKKILCKE